MRLILWLTTALIVLYGGYWYTGSRVVQTGTDAILAQLRNDGVADFGAVTLAGFPSRFDLTIADPVLKSSDGFLRWQAAFLKLYALSYKPHHVIAVWPHEQKIRPGTATIDLISEDMRASIVVAPAPSLPLERIQLVGRAIEAQSDLGWSVAARELRFATRRSDADGTRHDLGLELVGLSARADPQRSGHARFDATLALDRPVDRAALETGIGAIGIVIRSADAQWGEISVRVEGKLDFSASGYPEGRLNVELGNWRLALSELIAAGVIEPDVAAAAERMLEPLSHASGDPQTVKLPLDFAEGLFWLGPFPIARAPRF